MGERLGAFDKSCLHSTVKNTSGRSRIFSFLPPHGVTLAADEELTVFGNILETIGAGPNVIAGQRRRQALSAAIDRGDLEIVSTPAPILLDTVTSASKMLNVTSGALSAVSPCWESSDSEDTVAPV